MTSQIRNSEKKRCPILLNWYCFVRVQRKQKIQIMIWIRKNSKLLSARFIMHVCSTQYMQLQLSRYQCCVRAFSCDLSFPHSCTLRFKISTARPAQSSPFAGLFLAVDVHILTFILTTSSSSTFLDLIRYYSADSFEEAVAFGAKTLHGQDSSSSSSTGHFERHVEFNRILYDHDQLIDKFDANHTR